MSTIAPSSARASRKRRSSFSMNAQPAANYGLFPVPTPSGRETPRKKTKMDDKAPAKTPGKSPGKSKGGPKPTKLVSDEDLRDVGTHLDSHDQRNGVAPDFYVESRRRRRLVLLGVMNSVVHRLLKIGPDSGLVIDNLWGNDWTHLPPDQRRAKDKFQRFTTLSGDNEQVERWLDHLRDIINGMLPESDDHLPRADLPGDGWKMANKKMAKRFVDKWTELRDDHRVLGGYLLEDHVPAFKMEHRNWLLQ